MLVHRTLRKTLKLQNFFTGNRQGPENLLRGIFSIQHLR